MQNCAFSFTGFKDRSQETKQNNQAHSKPCSPLTPVPLAKASHVPSGTAMDGSLSRSDCVLNSGPAPHSYHPWRLGRDGDDVLSGFMLLFPAASDVDHFLLLSLPSEHSAHPGVQVLLRLLWWLLIFLLLWHCGHFPSLTLGYWAFPWKCSLPHGHRCACLAQCLTWFLGLTFPLYTSRSPGNHLRLSTSKVIPFLR